MINTKEFEVFEVDLKNPMHMENYYSWLVKKLTISLFPKLHELIFRG